MEASFVEPEKHGKINLVIPYLKLWKRISLVPPPLFSLIAFLFLQLILCILAGGESQSCCGRVISVKWGDYTRRIGIDGTPEAIKEAIRAAFRLRTKRTFWLEDEDQIIRSIDREMPLGNYTLHIDEG